MGLQLPMISVEGHVEPGWDSVADEFRKTFESYGEVGAALSVYHTGRPVVDLWAGIADKRSGRAWNDDTVAVVFSTTKWHRAAFATLLLVSVPGLAGCRLHVGWDLSRSSIAGRAALPEARPAA
jgi:CubicO group peptidase (beta-lactamase class C family)